MPAALVTGAGRGIGRTIAEHLAGAGWDVIAGVRSQRDADAVVAANPARISSVLLDVTDEAHIAALDAALPSRLDAVVNNAGIAVAGPMESVTSDDWRKQLDVNVIGQMAVTRAVLPRLRESHGRVVFISSVNGQLSFPLMGAYCASKFALEAAAAALRMEVQPFGVGVVVIEPAQTDTDMWHTAPEMVAQTEAAMTTEHRTLYSRHIAGMKKRIPLSQKMAVAPAKVAAVVEHALTTRRPRARYVVGVGPKVQAAVMTNLPARVRERVLRVVGGQP
ncbi:SDR family NAD(P)-dependent oxidoreductase [Mycolicibacterium arenosum]|uniref:SDR family NAD(P)-dependent oxidoreductase n=1 Tax=Mycolicibacterium arenosum TaxID=2952157 RepID=A0ABT1LZU7_9MYCO|nr:SDR family NAD(P)-dependent oxidoreductase [Mycolicibacterium sp. CAU 1645]MCP9272431.1 SDR family NAD(P)-dependent oxidoreductase [Mycolicibacterium sp. CAU 1645]